MVNTKSATPAACLNPVYCEKSLISTGNRPFPQRVAGAGKARRRQSGQTVIQ